jgi:hypothetical protein
MKYYNAPDDKRFSRMVRRDITIALLMAMATAIGFVVITLIAVYGQRYNF